MTQTDDQAVPILRNTQKHDVPENWPLSLLDADQLPKFDAFKAKARALLGSPETNDRHELESKWMSDLIIVKYMRATKYNLDYSLTRLEATLLWRRESKPESMDPSDVAGAAACGRSYFCGFDLNGRPLLFLVPRNSDGSKNYDEQLKFVIYNLEKATRMFEHGVSQVDIIIDYANMSMSNSVPLSVSRQFLQILGDHYPETLGLGFFVQASWYLSVFWNLISPFIDPVTKAKIHFVEEKVKDDKSSTTLTRYIAPEQLMVEYGGTCPYQFVFDTYWKHFSLV
ncbi:CRAL-TRIO domain-containing protein [Polychytrium aggregatum]|uniref:CRAL-TRIO domain-containing protein n=1 Tax=Polychytrium aggregatum TaxID=110093 RepID=UPI0022FEC909|nr:CRAL-TRIO domain-containing protein [Polychytrium aggregatum]KAI9206940.1 CRAL-TRIO domain-containing protein [Polychytrium aggregatum]